MAMRTWREVGTYGGGMAKREQTPRGVEENRNAPSDGGDRSDSIFFY